MGIELKPGDMAPEFSAAVIGGNHQTGDSVSLADFRGRTVVLYFYPKDDTPGCTTQACGLRDMWRKFDASGAAVFGVSVDSVESHRKFIAKYELPFALIADEDHKIVQSYGVWVEKSMYGKKFFGTERASFVIRPDGTIKSIFRKVKPAEHAEHIIEVLDGVDAK